MIIQSFLIPLLLTNICVSGTACERYGFKTVFGDISTEYSRKWNIDPVCPIGPPCHVFATLPEDGSSSFFLNVHTNLAYENISIEYKEALDEREKYKKVIPISWEFTFEALGDRMVHSVLISNLKPGTTYKYNIVYNNSIQYSSFYETFPLESDSTEIVIAIGGDVGSSATAKQITETIGNLSPDLFIIGGDGAYDNGLRSCYLNYDHFLEMFEKVNNKMNRTIPIILTVGNHDLGVNALSNSIPYGGEKYPLFFLFFPQHLIRDENTNELRMPHPDERETIFYHVIGKTLHVSLDSAYALDIEGYQSEWLESISKKYSHLMKFANYHNPYFSGCYLPADSPKYFMDMGYRIWGPIFEKYGYQGTFEHHFHLIKKTFPLINGTYHPNGVIFFGDGNWGTQPNKCLRKRGAHNETGVLELVGEENHVWMVWARSESWNYAALNKKGELFYHGRKEIKRDN